MKKIKISLTYPPDKVTKPITYHLIKDYDLQINILHADINLHKMGTLIVDIIGEEKNIDDGIAFMEEQGIGCKIFTKTIIWNENNCVHCGACTAVCPSGALMINNTNWELAFEKEKCLVCGLCVKACPLKVINISE
jgi:ferredoxin